MDKYFIFSDECGSWASKTDKFYLRSWIKIKESDYLYLEGLWKTKKLPKPTEKSLLKNSKGIKDELNKIEFKYFFTFTKLEEFHSRKFNVRDRILESVSAAISQLENQIKAYMRKIPIKINEGINQIMFLHIYEAYHIENAIDIMCDSENLFEFYIDKPQFVENDYLEVFNNKTNYKIVFIHKKESEAKNIGIYYADALSSLFGSILNNQDSILANYFKTNILPKSYAGNIGANGFNKIFYPVNKSYGSTKLREEENILINKISSILN